jgi:hypothetical protein
LAFACRFVQNSAVNISNLQCLRSTLGGSRKWSEDIIQLNIFGVLKYSSNSSKMHYHWLKASFESSWIDKVLPSFKTLKVSWNSVTVQLKPLIELWKATVQPHFVSKIHILSSSVTFSQT